MKILTISLATFLLSVTIAHSQIPQLQWAKQFGGVNTDRPSSMAVDDLGNIYTIGYFRGTFDCDPGDGTFIINSKSNTGVFITKINTLGNFIWAKSIVGKGDIYANSIVLDKSGHFYIAGYFSETADFDLGKDVYNLSNVKSNDASIFIAKYDTEGNMKWAKSMEGVGLRTGANSIALDKSGNVYTGGVFGGNVDFDPGVETFILNRPNGINLFILKLDNLGNFKWVKQFESTGTSEFNSIYSIAIDTLANIYTTGIFSAITDFDPGLSNYNLTHTSEGRCSSFISKLDSSGNFIAAASFKSRNLQTFASSIVVDYSGNTYITGKFYGVADFTPGYDSLTLTSLGNDDIYIAKWDSSNKFQWAKRIGGALYDAGQSIAIDALGNIYITGTFTGVVDFNPSTKVNPLFSEANSNGFILKLDSKGNYVWVQQLGPSLNHFITLDLKGIIYIAGVVGGIGDFDPGVGTLYLSPENGGIFIDKIMQVSLGVNEETIVSAFSIYPNPSSNSITVNFGKQITNGRVKLINLLGQTALEHSDINGISLTLDIAGQLKGMYFIEVSEGGNIQRMKFIKE